MSPDLIGWAASAVLLATLVRQIIAQARDPDSPAVSSWLFLGQIAASVGFTVYSAILGNAVFVFTNACILATAVAGQFLTWRRRRRGGSRPQRSPGDVTGRLAGPVTTRRGPSCASRREGITMSDSRKPNPVVDAISNAIGAIRADDDMHDLAKAHDELEPLAIEKLGVASARVQPTIADAIRHLLAKQGRSTDPAQRVPGITRTPISIPASGGALDALLYTPEGTGPHPVIVYFHGGGWVIADAEVYDGGARGLAREAGAIVVSVNYRLAPEHPFPAAWDDAVDAWTWVAANAASFNGDPARLALAGESAGGNLAVSTAITARDRGLAQPLHVLAVYPVAQTGSLRTESYLENAIAKPLNRAMIEWFVGHTFARDGDKADPRVDLEHAQLHGLPPVTIVNASIDPLRSDGSILEEALRKADVAVERRTFTGVSHEFFGCAAVVEKAAEAQQWAGQRLRGALGVTGAAHSTPMA